MEEGQGVLLLLEVLLSELGHWVGVGWKHLQRVVVEGVEWKHLQRMVVEGASHEDIWHLYPVALILLQKFGCLLAVGRMGDASQVPWDRGLTAMGKEGKEDGLAWSSWWVSWLALWS
jgi:hypothetical protein